MFLQSNKMYHYLLLDCLFIGLGIMIAIYLRFDTLFQLNIMFFITLLIAIFCYISFFIIYKIYRRMWEYASIGEMYSLIKASIFSSIVFYLVNEWIVNNSFPLSVYINSWIITMILIAGIRFYSRISNDSYVKRAKRLEKSMKHSLIIGADEVGKSIVQQLKNSNYENIYPVAFIDEDKRKHGLSLAGLKVYGGLDKVHEVVKKYSISLIIIAIPSASRSEMKRIIEFCKGTNCKIKVIPKMTDLISDHVSISQMRDVNVEDLLGRDKIDTDLESIKKYVTNKTVLITGAGGSIGSELSVQIANFSPKNLILLGHGENSIHSIYLKLLETYSNINIYPVIADIKEINTLDEIFSKYKPNIVFHAAAHKHVPLMEICPKEAIKNNIIGTYNVAKVADNYQVEKFIMISSDKAVNPTSVMGMTKRIAEILIQNLNIESKTKFAAVRFGNVLGSRGSVVPLFKKQIEKGGPVTVTHPDMTRYFMTIPEAVQLVIQAGALTKGGEIFVLDMGEPVKIEKLARDLIELSGFKPDEDIKIEYIGIRPGEKLYEELFLNHETHTDHERIFIRKSSNCRFPNEYYLEKIQTVLDYRNTDPIKNVLEDLVRESDSEVPSPIVEIR